MNYYKNDMDKYLEDKSNIFKYQKGSRASIDGTRHDSAESDVLIMGEKVACLLSEKYGTNIKSKFVVAGKEIVPKDWKIKIPGEHNLENIACAVSASRELGIPEEIIKKAVENFKGVSGRLELVRTINGVKIYNDTTATTPEATMAALRALSTKSEALNPKQSPKIQNSKLEEEKRIVLIMGGADKSLDMARLVEEIPKYCKTLILLEGNGTSKIGITKYELRSTKEEEKLIIHNSKFIIQGMIVNSLKQAVIEALSFAKKNDILLFSPAFASFGMFKNEYDRGEQFNEIVSSIRG
jgi:UDP-N-acetylmuramoylalanine--D-glutamate ligase